MKRLFICSLLSLLMSCWIPAQAQSQQINAVARATPAGRMLLRWVPSSATTWQQGNQSGYLIERTTLSRNGVPLATPITVSLTPQPLKPASAAQWQPYLSPDSTYHQALYEVLYSPDPAVPVDTTNKLIITQDSTTAAEQRYAFAMLAADQSFSAARLAALGFIDNTTQPGEQYRYRIQVAGQPGVTPGLVTIGSADALPLLPIAKPLIRFENKQAALQWSADTTVRGFNSYWIERSVDGQTFRPRNTLPLLSATQDRDTVTFQDSLPPKRQIYYYRLKGKTIFDEWGYSPVAFGQANVAVSHTPRITQARMPAAGTLEVHWRFPADTLLPRVDTLIQNYWIGASTTADGSVVALKVNIPATDTSTTIRQYGQKIPINGPQYITIAAMSFDGDTLRSYPVLVQPADSLPPAIPTGLRGTIDATGRVQIQWNPNTESDLVGYKVFGSEREGDEPSSRHGDPIPSTNWADTVSLNHLNRVVTYYVQAIDQQFNQSALSLPLKLIRPDTLRPASPWVKRYERTASGAKLHWVNSVSSDVVRHTLYRKAFAGADTSWQVVGVFTARDTVYVDEPLAAPADYAYNIIAEDAGGLQSPLLEPLLVSLSVRTSTHSPITVLNATAEPSRNAVRLDWSYTDPDVVKYELYRGEGASSLAPWQFVSAPQTTTWDERVKNDSTYRYAVRAIFRDGSVTGWQSQTVLYQSTDTTTNESPRLAVLIPDRVINQGEPITWTVPAGTFTDADGSIAQIQIVSAGLPTGISTSGTTLNGAANQTGLFTVTVRAEDNGGKATSTTFRLRVNARPVRRLDSLRSVAIVGRPFAYTLNPDWYTDTDGQVTSLQWDATGLPAGVQLNGLSLQGTLQNRGIFPIRLRVQDNEGAVTIDTLFLLGNQAPVVLTPPGSQTALWKEAYSYSIPESVFRDEDGTIISQVIVSENLPPGLQASGSRLEGVPTQPGQYTVRLVATDNQGATSEVSWPLVVGAGPNQAPVVATSLPVLLLSLGESVNYSVPNGTFFDSDGNIVAISIAGPLPTGLSATNGQISGIPSTPGNQTVLVTATDDQGRSVSTNLEIIVVNTLQTPIISGNTTICAGQSISLLASNCAGTVTWSTGATGNRLTVNPAGTTTYTATCRVGGVAGAPSAPAIVTVQAALTVTASNTGPVSMGQSIQLVATAPTGAQLQWSGPNGFTGSGANVSIPVASTTHSGSYTLVATIGGCSAMATTVVAVTSNTTLSLCIEAEDASQTTGTGTITNDPAASGGQLIGNYSNSSTNRRFNFSNIPITGSYQLQIRYLTPISATQATLLINEGNSTISLPQSSTTWTGGYRIHTSTRTLQQGANSIRIQGNGNGSFALDQVCLVRCMNPPAPTLTSSTICTGQSATLVASGCEGAVVWSTGATTNTLIVNPAATTSYSATCQINGGCVSVPATATVTVNPAFAVSVSSNSPVVAGQVLTLSATAPTEASLSWNGPNGFTANGPNPTIPASTSLQNGTYSVTAVIGTCTVIASTSVVISPSGSYNVCVEAEDATQTTGTGTVTSDAAASGGQRIGNYSNNSTNRRFNFTNVSVAGAYQFQIRYYTTAPSAQAVVLVNDGSNTITLSNAGPNGYNVFTLTKNLNPGTNTIRIQGNGTGSFALDRVCLVQP